MDAEDVSAAGATDQDAIDAPPDAPPILIETTSFDHFYGTSHARLVRALSLALGDDELGRDAAAEGFTRALQRWRKVSTFKNPAGWTYRVGLNWARSRLRKLRREVHTAVDERAVAHDPPDPITLAALGELTVDHRAVVVGRFYLDWSEAQLAAALGISPGTVKSRLSRAVARLSEILEDERE